MFRLLFTRKDVVSIRLFYSLLLMSLSLALASKLPIGKLFIGSLLASVSESDIKSNALKMSNWGRFLFLLVLRIGCVILLWQSLGLPYNYLLYFT